ncbi:MAG: uroporphyrinogen decarboxylase [Bacteroidetes bacterium]|nr:uroporphyrinogen decarboxylase [Bacteroidota bacterium]
MNLKNDLILRAARGEKTERTPVWLMRQAGRILPEYRKVREQAGGFKKMVKTPALAAEVTLQPVDILGVDAAIIFSDILVIPEAMGLNYEVIESRGPWFEKTIQSKKDIDALKIAEGNDLQYVIDAISLTKKELNGRVPLIGFAGAPWTLFSYMIEGRGSKTFSNAKKFLYTEPALAHQLLEKIALSTINYLNAQIEAGADLVQIFDSWAGILSPEQYREFSLKYISMICNAIQENGKKEIENGKTLTSTPVIVFAKGAFFARKELGKLNCEVIGLDWNMEITESRKLIGNNKTLQGNMDPCLLYSDDETIVRETEKMLREFGPQRHIANLGHGLYPDIQKEKVKLFIDTVKNFRHGS